jgi:hypothetical protein
MDLLVAAPKAESAIETPVSARRLLHPWDILLPVSVVFWAFGLRRVPATHLGQYGLPASLPFVFYLGVGLLVISIGWALAMARPSSIRLGAHLGILLLMLYGTAPLVYEESRYSWLFKYIGVVQYVNTQGHVNQHIDIFQNWPGFFALIAWFDDALGVKNPIGYAKWAQLGFEVLTCLMLSFLFRALPLTVRERWLALFLYAGSIWIAQDYLSPQALGVVFSAGIFGLALTYLPRGEEARWLAWLRRHLEPIGRILRPPIDPSMHLSEISADGSDSSSKQEYGVQEVAVVIAILLVYFVLVFEHELSPYVVLIQLACLAVIGRLRHRWVVIVLGAIAVGYFAPRFSFVNAKFGIVASFGNFFGNATPPLVALGKTVKVTAGVTASADAARLLTLGMWALAAVGAVRRWRNRRPTLALVLLAYSPGLVFFAGAYGNEGLLRVFLFSLPWTACLAASAIKPVAASESRLGALRAPVVLAVVIALFFPAFFGDDYSYVMSKGEVQGSAAFYQSAAPGTVFIGDGNFPSGINQRYNDFPEVDLFDNGGILFVPNPPLSNAAALTQAIVANNPNPKEPAYVILTNSMQAFGTAFGFLYPGEIQKLQTTLDSAPGWIRIYDKQGFTVFELPPTT